MRIVHRHHVYITQHLKDPTSVCQVQRNPTISNPVMHSEKQPKNQISVTYVQTNPAINKPNYLK